VAGPQEAARFTAEVRLTLKEFVSRSWGIVGAGEIRRAEIDCCRGARSPYPFLHRRRIVGDRSSVADATRQERGALVGTRALPGRVLRACGSGVVVRRSDRLVRGVAAVRVAFTGTMTS